MEQKICSRLIFYSTCPTPGISDFSKVPWIVSMEDGMRTHGSVCQLVDGVMNTLPSCEVGYFYDTHVVRPVRPTVLACCYTSSAGACSLGLRSRCVEHQETCKISNGGAGGEKGGETQI